MGREGLEAVKIFQGFLQKLQEHLLIFFFKTGLINIEGPHPSKKKKLPIGSLFLLVGREGLEPSRHFCHWILSPTRIPVPPPAHIYFWRPRPELNRGKRFCRPLRKPLRHEALLKKTGLPATGTGLF